jgi:DNA polymerase II large subunit
VKAEFPLYFCEKCNQETIYSTCEDCGEKTKQRYYSFFEKEVTESPKTAQGKNNPLFNKRKINIKKYFDKAKELIHISNGELPSLIKGVRGTSSTNHDFEHLVKGILRAKYNLNVNKDGTIRYDMTELPITHFKPREIGTSIEKLISLGYEKDYEGNYLKDDNQILELKPQDIILSSNVESGDEKADDVFLNIANFVDELLERFYKLPKFYNLKSKEDLIGHLSVCMAPHNCAGVISRIIGFSKTQGLFASPYMHAAMRRDCDGDEAATMLLLDVLINFSKKYIPSHRGGTQDAPLVLNGKIDAGEVDDQILDFELVNSYPLDLYEKAEKRLHSSEVKIEMVKQRLNNKLDPFVNIGFTHKTSDINSGVLCSSYKKLPTMKEKVAKEMEFVQKMRAVDTSDVARLIIERHFIRDIRGNLRKFSQQGFRCVSCNEKFRRPPLSGKCTRCNGKIIFTISEGGIVKYLEPAIALANNYDIPIYIKQNLELTKKYIESIFGREETKQADLAQWF